MTDEDLVEIIKLCIALDIIAYKTYLGISQGSENSELQQFWADMAAEEKEHAGYWNSALKLAEQDSIPQLFDDPAKIRKELLGIHNKIETLLRSELDPRNITDTFLLACRMEFFMTHHAFETLLQFVNCMELKKHPEQYYEEHINKFIVGMNTFGASTPSLELLGESLQRSWMENKTLSSQNSIDELTGVRNRRGFFSIASIFGSFAKRNQFTIGVMMADIDHFKKVNDTYGHAKGDQVLKRVAHILQEKIRPSDVLGRYGGEEFIIYMSQIDPHAAHDVAEKLREAVEEEEQDGIRATISIGIACGILPTQDNVESSLLEFISRADACLYEAKNTGRNKVVAAQLQVHHGSGRTDKAEFNEEGLALPEQA
jgi:diguanylate cyclase (GGDEF)-like protein